MLGKGGSFNLGLSSLSSFGFDLTFSSNGFIIGLVICEGGGDGGFGVGATTFLTGSRTTGFSNISISGDGSRCFIIGLGLGLTGLASGDSSTKKNHLKFRQKKFFEILEFLNLPKNLAHFKLIPNESYFSDTSASFNFEIIFF